MIRLVNLININLIMIIILNNLHIKNYVILIIVMIVNIILFSVSQKFLINKFGLRNLFSGKKVFLYITILINILIITMCIWQQQYIYLAIFCSILILYYLFMIMVNRFSTKGRMGKNVRIVKQREIKMIMHNKEKKILVTLGAILTIGLFVYLLFPVTDSFGLHARLLGNNLMKIMKSNHYKVAYQYFSSNYNKSEQYFIDEQSIVNTVLGDIKTYKFKGQTAYRINNNNITSVAYNVNYEKYSKKSIGLIWYIDKNGNHWEVLDNRLDTDPTIMRNINKQLESMHSLLNGNLLGNDTLDKVTELAEYAVNAFRKADYEKIFLRFDSSLKYRGTQSDFIDYVQFAEKRYGRLESFVLDKYLASKNNLEVELQYKCKFDKFNGQLVLAIWIKKGENLSISGFKFVEGKW